MVLPWYEKSFFDVQAAPLRHRNLSALQVFTFVEAAVLLVAAAVMFLVYARAQQQGLPPARAATAWRSCSPAAGRSCC